MAEISKITLPNGDTYDLKDSVARGNVDHGNARIFSADCSTAAATQRKDVTITECTELIAGDVFVITFTNYQNYNGTPTIQINSLGAKIIRRITGTNAGRYEWASGETIIFVWNGTYFLILNGGFATTTVYGRTKLYTGAGSSSTTLALNPASLYNMANRSICPYYSTSATYAVGDKVRYGDYIYECITAITTAEAWTAAHWKIAPTLQEQITALDGNVAAVQDGLAIVANGDTHAAVAEGQFVYVRNHSTLAEGLYKASSAIGTNVALSTSNLTADGSGGLNDLQEQVTSLNSDFVTIHSASSVSSKLASGAFIKYIKVGMVVIVLAKFTTTDTLSGSSTLFVLPAPLNNTQAVIAMADGNTGISDGNVLYIRSNGECRAFNGLAANKVINASGAYISV